MLVFTLVLLIISLTIFQVLESSFFSEFLSRYCTWFCFSYWCALRYYYIFYRFVDIKNCYGKGCKYRYIVLQYCSHNSRPAIELESCSNHLRIQQVFWFRFKKSFWFGFGVFCGLRHIGACFRVFLAEVSWHWAPTQPAIFLDKVVLETRLSSESLEPLIGFLAYLEPKRGSKNKIWEKVRSHKC